VPDKVLVERRTDCHVNYRNKSEKIVLLYPHFGSSVLFHYYVVYPISKAAIKMVTIFENRRAQIVNQSLTNKTGFAVKCAPRLIEQGRAKGYFFQGSMLGYADLAVY
jgi:hypothetical protein